MGKTSIGWTDHSINPIRARLKADPSKVGHYCEKISAGCTHCYASRFQPRRGLPEYGNTHWIATQRSDGSLWIFDINSSWTTPADWQQRIVPMLVAGIPRATGNWWTTHTWTIGR